MKKRHSVIGIMSGSSLDGLDICLSEYWESKNRWQFEIIKSSTRPLPDHFYEDLKFSAKLDQGALDDLDIKYGEWIAHETFGFVGDVDSNIDLIAVHGHTVFHEPKKGLSRQLGDGHIISKITGIPVVVDFRMEDIRLGGQGAPLVPVGEYYLFPGFDGFVNLGGIANLTVRRNDRMRAWDVCPCNQVLNYFSSQLGKKYDSEGEMAKSGVLQATWHASLDELEFFHQKPPKSLSNQWGLNNIIGKALIDPKDGLRTYCEFMASRIAHEISEHSDAGARILFSGGGVKNNYLVDLVREKSQNHFEIIIPDTQILEFKEALIFGFLGLLRTQNKINVFSSVTGARRDNVSGKIFLPVG